MEGIIHDPRAVQMEEGRRTTLSGFNIFARFRGAAGCNHRRGSASNELWRQMDMKMRKNWLATAALLAALPVTTLLAGPTKQAGSLEDRVRHELVMLPYFNVFDDLSFRVENDGTVTLFGAVTKPWLKSDAEKSVKRIPGVTRVDNKIEVLPLSPMDDQIRLRTYRALVRTSSLDRYFLGTQPSIRIVVKNGHVMLDGVVDRNMDSQLAYMAANSVPGVFSVTNNLRTEIK
jgi:hyperosmotically inducible periplasmic protein